MSSRGLSSLLATPSTLRLALLQAALAAPSTTFASPLWSTPYTSPSRSRPFSRQATKPTPKTSSRASARTDSKPAPKTAKKTTARKSTRTTPKLTTRAGPIAKTVQKPASKPAKKATERTPTNATPKPSPRAGPKTASKTSPESVLKQSKSASQPAKRSPARNTTERTPTKTPDLDLAAAERKPPAALSFIHARNAVDTASNESAKSAGVSLVTDTNPADLFRAKSLFTGGRFLHSSPRFLNLPFNSLIPEVCLLGRSNVGKSTLINALAGMSGKEAGRAHGHEASRAGVAITSSRAGCTKLMNAYGFGPPLSVKREKRHEQPPKRVGGRSRSERRKSEGVITEPPPKNSIILMDVPGYGFNSESSWGQEIMKYLEKREILRGAVLLIDAYTGVKAADKTIMKALRDIGVCTSVVLTKADELVKKRDHDAWANSESLREAALHVLEEMRKVERMGDPGIAWAEGIEWSPEIFVTGAGDPRMGGMGVDGARLAIARMAGHIKRVEPMVEKEEDDADEIVPYDQLVFGPSSTTSSDALFTVRSAQPEAPPAEKRVIDPTKTQGRKKRGRKATRPPVTPQANDPMAALLSGAHEPTRKQLGRASF